MPKPCVRNFSISLDGNGAGPNQGRDNPIGERGLELHQWMFATRSFGLMHSDAAGRATGTDDDFVARSDAGIGATIMAATCSAR